MQLTYNGNDAYMDNGAQIPGQQTVAWDSRQGSLAMNGCDWVQSSWTGSMGKLCAVWSTGTIKGLLVWKGTGPAPKTASVRIESALYARYTETSLKPQIDLNNGLGSRMTSCRIDGRMETKVEDSRIFELPVQNGTASFNIGISGRVAGLMSGGVALRIVFHARPID